MLSFRCCRSWRCQSCGHGHRDRLSGCRSWQRCRWSGRGRCGSLSAVIAPELLSLEELHQQSVEQTHDASSWKAPQQRQRRLSTQAVATAAPSGCGVLSAQASAGSDYHCVSFHPPQKACSIFALLTVGEDADAEGADVVTVASLMHCTTAAKSSLAFHITKQELMVSLSATAMV